MPLPTPYAYLIILDVNTPDVDYSRFGSELQRSENWWHFISNTWIVLRREAMVELQSLLLPLIGSQDRLLILPARGPGAGWLPGEAWTWLQQNIPNEWGPGSLFERMLSGYSPPDAGTGGRRRLPDIAPRRLPPSDKSEG